MMHLRLHLAAALAATGIFAHAPAFAQSSSCQDGQKILSERQSLIQQVNALGGDGKKKQVDPRAACRLLTRLSSNGDAGVKWIEANKDWCQIPDQFAENFKQDHTRAVNMRGQACQAAAKMAEQQRQAREGQRPGLLGGSGLTGTYTIPRGAL